MPILRDPEALPDCDVLIAESTYGDRLHPSPVELMNQIRDFIEEQRGTGGRILIPAFSVGRTQNILWYLGNLIHEGVIDHMPIYIDSPLSSKATTIVARHRELFDKETRAVLESGRNPFFFDGVRCVSDVEESKSLNQLEAGIIISASGMCEGGRILHHLERTLGRPQDCILLVGFQAQGTLGRKLLEGYEYVKVFGERHRVRCRVRHIDGLSAHGDYREMVEHLTPIAATTKQVYVVHGEENAAMRFADHLLDAGFKNVEVPLYKEEFSL
jgi:metallo-beta-lactamase family protein